MAWYRACPKGWYSSCYTLVGRCSHTVAMAQWSSETVVAEYSDVQVGHLIRSSFKQCHLRIIIEWLCIIVYVGRINENSDSDSDDL